MAYNNKPPSYDNAGYAPPFTTPQQYPQFQSSGVPRHQQYAGPPPTGTPYYPPQQQARYNHGNVTVAGAYPSPTQQPQVVIVNSHVQPASVSMAGAIALSCVTFWICGWLFGGIAFVLAIVGQNAASAGDVSGAIRMRNASYGVSIVGIIIGIIVIYFIIRIGCSTANSVPQTQYSSTYCYYNSYYSNYKC